MEAVCHTQAVWEEKRGGNKAREEGSSGESAKKQAKAVADSNLPKGEAKSSQIQHQRIPQDPVIGSPGTSGTPSEQSQALGMDNGSLAKPIPSDVAILEIGRALLGLPCECGINCCASIYANGFDFTCTFPVASATSIPLPAPAHLAENCATSPGRLTASAGHCT